MGKFVFLGYFILFSICGCILHVVYWPIKYHLLRNNILSSSKSRQINYIIAIGLLSAILVSTYLTLNPGRDFYASEFEKVTLKNLPESAVIISRSSEYPDFHGDYCSSSSIRLKNEDFKSLLQHVKNDVKMEANAEIVGSDPFSFTLDNSNDKKIIYSFTRKAQDDRYLFIGFCSDGETIFINVCQV